jgi:dynein light intermediate chain 2
MTARDDFEDLWTLAEEEKRKNEEKQTQESNKQSIETHVLFIGSQNSGKTTLILQFLDREEPPKPTIALEYTYGRRPKGINMAKDVTHLWELGGGTMLSKLISVPITPETISNVSVIIVLDLSKPEELWDTLEVLLKEVNEYQSNGRGREESEKKDRNKKEVWEFCGCYN